MTLSGAALRPLRLMTRPMMSPVTPVTTGVLTHSLSVGVTGVRLSALAGTAVALAPALSPCQALLRPTSPELRRSVLIVTRPPRFGTSCHISPLDLLMSIGLTMKNVAMYSTLPLALRFAFFRSVISEFRKSCGSSSPKARPVIVSYCPALPKLGQTGGVPVQNAGDTFESTTTLVTRASDGGAQANASAAASALRASGCEFL